jgi:DNA-binding transcriptional regulator YhcF (GntR family)
MYLKIPVRRVYHMLEREELPVRRRGKKALVARKSELDKWFSANEGKQ